MCSECKYYYELKNPKAIDVKNNLYIYGYCYKPPYGTQSGFPVYLPEGHCKDIKHKKAKSAKADKAGTDQLTLSDYFSDI